MALIVEQHVVANSYPVGTTAIQAGMLVSMVNDGTVIPAGADSTIVLGIAGDSFLAAEGQTTAYSAEVVIGASDADTARTRWTSNRISDMFNETLASGKITVYNGGGKFWISDDLITGELAIDAGELLESETGGNWATGNTAGEVVAIAVGHAAKYPSGVPGTDTPDGSLALGTSTSGNNWLPVNLRI